MYKGIKLRLYPNTDQQGQLEQLFGNDRFVWNQLVEMITERYENNPSLKIPSFYNLNKLLVPLKQEYEFLKLSDSTSLQSVVKNFRQSYNMFFKHIGEKPHFHSKYGSRQSYSSFSSTFKVVAKRYCKLPKLGYLKTSKTNQLLNTDIKRYTVTKNPDGKYYLSVIVEFENQKFFDKTGKSVGIDLGLKNLAITSDGQKFDKLNFKELDHKVRTYQSKFDKRKNQADKKVKRMNHEKTNFRNLTINDFHNWQKARILKAKNQKKIANIRLDVIHKITTELVKNYDTIVIEDLKSKNMMKNHKLANAVSNHAWFKFRTLLEYKCDWYGKQLIVVDPKNTSRICSNCGTKNKEFNNLNMNQWLNVRSWTCSICNTTHDRDINAAKNILTRGLISTNVE